jgi:biotin carboxylase
MSFNAETGEKESSQVLWEGSSWEKMGRNRGRTMEKANSFIGRKGEEAIKELDKAIGVVDPFSTGLHLAAEVRKRGYKCVRIFSIWDSPVANLVQEGLTVDYCATVQHNDRAKDQDIAIDDTAQQLRDLPFEIVAIVPGAETGVELADQLSSRMGMRTNGVEKSLARRNKYHMGERVRSAGVRAVKQAVCTTEDQVNTFLKTIVPHGGSLANLRCVVKPVQSAGTDDVFLCKSADEALVAFNKILGTMNGIGLLNENVLVQEFLVGKEHVVDKVSRDGVHKVIAIWQYDKRPVNGAAFVYYGMKLCPADSPQSKVLIEYADKILDALDINNGPSHMEVMLNTIDNGDGTVTYDPCLVEVGARCHGGEGTWLPVVSECIGYSVVDVTLDVYLDGKFWEKLDKDYFPLKKAGRSVDLVSRNSGIVRSLPGDAIIRKLKSIRTLDWEVKPGDFIHKTIDCYTRPGCAQLVADTEEEAEHDLEWIHEFEVLGCIDYSIICPNPPVVGAIVVVDPFSSGANISAQVLKWGYKLILVFSEMDSPVGNLIASSGIVPQHLHPTLMIQHNSTLSDQDEAINITLEEITKNGSPVLAILTGSETGIELADRLANRFGTRCNDETLIEARKNKFHMQEIIRKNGSRAIHQSLCFTEGEVKSYLQELKGNSNAPGFKCIVKPNESSGSDCIYVCRTEEDAIRAFHSIHGQFNGLGKINHGALCQEYLDGKEYAIDGISRDGIYKILAIWEYDKRSVNNANFVHFGMKLRDSSDHDIRPILEYAHKVVNSLKITQGPSHMEVIYDSSAKGSPCLVEIATRCHGGEGTWTAVVNECIGYNQIDATLSCYVRPDNFDNLPLEPHLLKNGCELFLVSYETGTILDIPGIDKIRGLSSVRYDGCVYCFFHRLLISLFFLFLFSFLLENVKC